MTNANRNDSSWRSMLPKGRPALMGVLLVAVVAFFSGALLFNGGSVPPDEGIDHAAEASAEPSVWTCSMHPQIQLAKPGKCPLCFMDLIPLESGGDDGIDPDQLRMSETAKQLARIETTPVRRAFAEREVRMVGKVAYDETSVAYITAWVPGRLDRLYADYSGMTVNKGDHMVNIYSPELLAAQEELLQAKEAVSSLTNSSSRILKSTAVATLDATREKLVLYGLSDTQIAEIERSGSPTDILTINAPIGGIVVHKDAQEGMYVKTGTRIYTLANLTKLWILFQAYESDLPWLRYGQKAEFRSPSFPGESFDATVSFIDPIVDPRTRTVKIRAIIANEDLKLKPDMFVRGVIKARIDSNGDVIDEDLAGKWISPMHPEVVKSGPGSCDVCGMPLVPAESLGYASRTVTNADAPLVIPATAPLQTGKRAVVYIEIANDDGPLFEGRQIELGPRAGDFYVVKSGLEEGDMVVTNGAFRIDSELQIQAKPSMMSPDGGAPAPGHQHGGNATVEMPEMTMTRVDANDDVTEALKPVYEAYFLVQMALAGDDHNAAAEASRKLETAIAAVDMNLFSQDGHERWMMIHSTLTQSAGVIAASSDIEAARTGFFELSSAAIDMQESFGHSGAEPYYLTYCPMAFDNTGAHWLQQEDIVWNSFYGAAMLRCGEIKKPLSARSSEGAN